MTHGRRLFDDVLAGNAAYADDFRPHKVGSSAAKSLAVLTCMDARIDPLAMLGLAPSDAVVLRNAGARVTDDVVRSLVLASTLLGVGRLMVIGHTRCRLTAESDDAVRASIREAGGADTTEITFLAAPDPVAAVRDQVRKLRSSPHLGQLPVGGFLYDVDTGKISQIS